MGRELVPSIRASRRAVCAGAALLAVLLYPAASARAASFTFSTGSPDGKIAMASRPASTGKPEIEAGDDFVLSAETTITHATFTGLMPASSSVQLVNLEIYHVFPVESNTSRTPRVPTRVNSPSDVDFVAHDSSKSGGVTFSLHVLNSSFTAANSVLNGIHPAPNQTTGGDGKVSGEEVLVEATLNHPFVLAAGHYFFVPQVQLTGPSTPNFFWLSAPHPVAAPGTPFPPGATDLQAWIRNAALQPDWLRVGTDIVGGATPPLYNASFTLNNAPLPIKASTQQLAGEVGIRLSLTLPTAGSLQVQDPLVGTPGASGHKAAWFNGVLAKVRGGTSRLAIVPNAIGRKQLARRRALHLSLIHI